ncbi:MAG: NADH-quinone oxidoreductase subunit H [Anaerolineales bacterium]|nr:NADH-quinone oxidoreductase subunit H [Anaerolineales bacterium]
MDLEQLLLGAFYTIIFPGFLFTAVVGLFITWVDRKVTAIVQSRVGPPWFQPYADIGKLLAKKMLIPQGSQAVGFLAAPLLAVAGSTLIAVIVLRALLDPGAGFVGDLIVLIYLSAVPSIALIIGGASSRSPFGAIGAGREMGMILSYELGFLLSIFIVLIKVRSFVLGDIVAYQAQHGAIIGSVSGIIAFGIALFTLQAKLGYLPFDIAEADTELIGGPLAEYSGSGLALFKLARARTFFCFPVLVIILFLGATVATPLSVIGFVLKLLAVLGLIILVKATHARLRLDQALRLFWGKVFVVAVVGVVLATIGW